MKYRTKLLLFGMALVTLTCALVLTVVFRGNRKLVLGQIQRHVKLIAADAAARVDAGTHERILVPGDESGDAYREVELALREVRDRYRREGFDVAFVYTLRPSASEPGKWEYVVDAEEEDGEKSFVGDTVAYEADNPLDARLELVPHAYADQDFTHDEFGSWLSGNAPLKDAQGRVVAMVGIDVRADDVIAETSRLFRQSAVAGSLALLIGIGGSFCMARWATRPLSEITLALDRIGEGKLDERVSVTREDEFAELGLAVNTMAQSLEEQLALKCALSRHVSRDFSRHVLSTRNAIAVDGEEREVSVLFCDIRNLEVLADSLKSDRTVPFLNEYFQVMVDAVFSNGGTLDKFSGDGFMATFGAAGKRRKHQADAVRAAILIHREHGRLMAEWREDGDMPLRLGIGIHSGRARVGDSLETSTMAYSAVGEAVDMAARVEGYNRRLGTSCLISGTTRKGIEELFDFVDVSEIGLPAGEGSMGLFTLREMVECRLSRSGAAALTA